MSEIFFQENRQRLADDVHIVEESLGMVDDCFKVLDTSKYDYITQTPFEIYEKTSGRIPPICASNHFLTHKIACLW